VSQRARTPDEIVAEIDVTRNRLAGTIDHLVYRVQPKTIASRQIASIKASFYDESGALDKAMLAKVAGGVVGFLALIVLIRKIAG
jgi:Protein of unknown function (DUF3618)